MYFRLLGYFIFLFGIMLWLGAPQDVRGVPASPKIHNLTQPDGTTFQAKMWGDEWLNGWETTEEYTILQDEASERWYYADTDAAGSLVPTGVPAHSPPPSWLQTGLKPSDQATVQKVQARRAQAQQRVVPPEDTANLPVLLIEYPDAEHTNTPAQFRGLIFGSDPGNASGPGSMRDFYQEASYGQFDVHQGPSGIGGWYTSENEKAYYGDDEGSVRAAELVKEAVEAADEQGYNFEPYDINDDGYVNVVGIVHQGRGAEESGDGDDIWSHRWSLENAGVGEVETESGKIVDDYIIMPERYGEDNISTIGVFSHEYGHALGLPDLYDTSGDSAGIGDWGVMGSGSWNQENNPGDSPAHFIAWSKYVLDWIDPEKLKYGLHVDTEIEQVVSSNSQEPGDVYKLLNNPGGVNWKFNEASGDGEYFLLENRQHVGFDVGLPGAGLLIWHVKEDVQEDNTANQWNPHPLVALKQADGENHLKEGENRGDDGDPYPGSELNRYFQDNSEPDSKRHDGRSTGCVARNISDSSEVMEADLGCRFVVNKAQYDDIGEIIQNLYLDFGYYELEGDYEKLADPEFNEVFQGIFLNCAGDFGPDNPSEEIKEAVREYVESGGLLYASDFAYPYISEIFPEYVTFPDDPYIGEVQTVQAAVTNPSLENYLEQSTAEIFYDLGGWVVMDNLSQDVDVLLRGDVEVANGDSESPAEAFIIGPMSRSAERATAPKPDLSTTTLEDEPLAIQFEYGEGTVVFTTFHNEPNITEEAEKILEYYTFLPDSISSMEDIGKFLIDLGYEVDPDSTAMNVISGGQTASYDYYVDQEKDINFVLGFGGSKMKLSVYEPDGTLYEEKESTTSPISIEIPKAEGGSSYEYEVSAIKVPHDNYAYAVATGNREVDNDTGNGSSGCTVNPGQPLGLEWLILGLIGLGVYMRRRLA